jgi:hypothetical protein
MARTAIVGLVPLLALFAAPAPTNACVCTLTDAGSAMPSPGTTAPPDTLIWIPSLADGDNLVLSEDGTAIPIVIEHLDLGRRTGAVVRPKRDLSAGATITLTARFNGHRSTLTTFVVDDAAHSPNLIVNPTLDVLATSSADITSCGSFSGATATLDVSIATPSPSSSETTSSTVPAAPIPLLVYRATAGDVAAAPSRRPDAILFSTSPTLTDRDILCSPPNIASLAGPLTIVVTDLAGNRGEPLELTLRTQLVTTPPIDETLEVAAP